jgi:hypothetical protein
LDVEEDVDAVAEVDVEADAQEERVMKTLGTQ